MFQRHFVAETSNDTSVAETFVPFKKAAMIYRFKKSICLYVENFIKHISVAYTAEQNYALEYQITDLSIIKHNNVDKPSLIADRSTSFSDTLHNSL